MAKKNNPGCNCCDACENESCAGDVWSDCFDYLDRLWTPSSGQGTWEIESGRLVLNLEADESGGRGLTRQAILTDPELLIVQCRMYPGSSAAPTSTLVLSFPATFSMLVDWNSGDITLKRGADLLTLSAIAGSGDLYKIVIQKIDSSNVRSCFYQNDTLLEERSNAIAMPVSGTYSIGFNALNGDAALSVAEFDDYCYSQTAGETPDCGAAAIAQANDSAGGVKVFQTAQGTTSNVARAFDADVTTNTEANTTGVQTTAEAVANSAEAQAEGGAEQTTVEAVANSARVGVTVTPCDIAIAVAVANSAAVIYDTCVENGCIYECTGGGAGWVLSVDGCLEECVCGPQPPNEECVEGVNEGEERAVPCVVS